MVDFGRAALKTIHASTLSYALRRPRYLRMVRWMFEQLEELGRPQPGEVVALDSMPITLRKSVGRACKKINALTVGGGVMWTYRVDAPRGAHPIQILKITAGALTFSTA